MNKTVAHAGMISGIKHRLVCLSSGIKSEQDIESYQNWIVDAVSKLAEDYQEERMKLKRIQGYITGLQS